MLIGIDASRASRKFKGGTEWYSYYLIKELARLDSVNQYILYSDCALSGGLADLVRRHPNFKVKILNWPLLYFWTQIRLSWEMLFHAPDILFVPAHTLPAAHPPKSVVTIHDIGFERFQGLYSSDKIGPARGLKGRGFDSAARLFTLGKFRSNILDYHSWSAKFALKHAKKIIAVSRFTKQEMIDVYRTDGSKIEVIYNGCNRDVYKKIKNQDKINLVLDKYDIKAPYIFYIGRLERKKNTAGLIAAYAVMREKYKNLKHKLVLAGNASFGFDEVKYMIEEFELENDVITTGWAPEADKPFLYNGASLFVFPSFYEGFGIPLLEAMACGVPIAASDAAAIPEVAKDAALLFDPADSEDLAEKMARVLLDKDLAADLVARGQARLKDFSLEKCARETLDLLEKL